jgi:hypothetical protein
MKRSSLLRQFKQTALTLPTAALMLGAAQAGTSVGIDFKDSSNGNSTAYLSTSVSNTAFGIDPIDWFSTPLDSKTNSLIAQPSSGGSFNVAWKAKGATISWSYPQFLPGYLGYPGDTNVYN